MALYEAIYLLRVTRQRLQGIPLKVGGQKVIVIHISDDGCIFPIPGPQPRFGLGYYGVRIGVTVDEAVQPDTLRDSGSIQGGLFPFYSISDEVADQQFFLIAG